MATDMSQPGLFRGKVLIWMLLKLKNGPWVGLHLSVLFHTKPKPLQRAHCLARVCSLLTFVELVEAIRAGYKMAPLRRSP